MRPGRLLEHASNGLPRWMITARLREQNAAYRLAWHLIIGHVTNHFLAGILNEDSSSIRVFRKHLSLANGGSGVSESG